MLSSLKRQIKSLRLVSKKIYRKEKKIISARLQKVLDLSYLNKLTLKVEKYQKILSEHENSKKLSNFKEKKENKYKHDTSKPLEISLEIENLNTKKQVYISKATEIEKTLEKNKIFIAQGNKKIDDLEKKHKRLSDIIGESLIKKKSTKLILDTINNRQKIKGILVKEADSKISTMLTKIKSLQNELKLLKGNENNVNSQVLNTSKKIDSFQDHLRYSPLSVLVRLVPETRAHSVKPIFYPSFFTEIS